MIVYLVTNTINQKKYVGITKFSLEFRWQQHVKSALKGRNKRRVLWNAIRKHTPDVFNVECLETCTSVEHLKEREVFWISELKTHLSEMGYNMTFGGDGCFGLKREPFTAEHCAKLSYARSNVSDETRQKYRAAKLNTKLPEEVKKKIGLKNSRSVCQFDLEGILLSIHRTMKLAQECTGVRYQYISRACLGKQPTAGGFVWRYNDDSFI